MEELYAGLSVAAIVTATQAHSGDSEIDINQ